MALHLWRCRYNNGQINLCVSPSFKQQWDVPQNDVRRCGFDKGAAICSNQGVDDSFDLAKRGVVRANPGFERGAADRAVNDPPSVVTT